MASKLKTTSSGLIRARVCGVITPTSPATKVAGGYRVSGKWFFASGSARATWAIVAIPVTTEAGETVGRSPLVGRPMAALLMERDATVAVCHTRTANLTSRPEPST